MRPMRPTHEMLVPDDAPTPKQLFQLAVHGVALARQYGKLRDQVRSGGSYVRAAVLPYAESMPTELEGVPNYTLGRQASLRLARAGLNSWSMFVRLQHHFTQEQLQEDGSLNTFSQVDTYGFRWNPRGTEVARRRIIVLPALVTAEYDLSDQIDHFQAPDELSQIWNAQSQMEQVTAADMPDLMSEMRYLDDAYLMIG